MDHICHNCGAIIICDAKRHNHRGEGYHDANKIKVLGRTRMDIIDVLAENVCITWHNGKTLQDLVPLVNTYRAAQGRKPLNPQTISGRLSELQGLGIVSCRPVEVELSDPMAYEWAYKEKPQWYLPKGMKPLELAA